MSYLVLARKYRPQTFADLAGQEHVAQTLANAIAHDRVAHAFLFTGVRGVGKTTSARLLAKCLNCLGADGAATRATSTPCLECAACREIAQGTDIDVQEIDGASYNGVDEVRRLQETLAFRPARDRYKVYIVDEVHMLSNAAWNAFLKTLEEPPPHVKFIFATTEAHKVPVTILSRCQRYDFKLISAQTVLARLEQVLRAEGIAFEGPALGAIAREAAGSMRDAMSLLDQVIAFATDQITADAVARVLGIADRAAMNELASAVVTGDGAQALRTLAALADRGFDLVHVARDLLAYLRALVVARTCADSTDDVRTITDLTEEEVADVTALASRTTLDDLVRLFHGFSRTYDEIARGASPRAAFEVALVRLARRPALYPLDELLARLADLERRVASGSPPPPRGGGSGPSSGGARSRDASGSGDLGRAQARGPGERTMGALALAPPLEAPPLRAVALRAEAPPLEAVAPPPMPEPAPAPVARARPASPSATEAEIERTSELIEPLRPIAEAARRTNPALAALVEQGAPLELTAERLLLAFEPGSFAGEQLTDAELLAELTTHVRQVLSAHASLAIDLSAPRGLPTIARVDEARREAALAAARAVVEHHPLVQKLLALFGGSVREIRLPPDDD